MGKYFYFHCQQGGGERGYPPLVLRGGGGCLPTRPGDAGPDPRSSHVLPPTGVAWSYLTWHLANKLTCTGHSTGQCTCSIPPWSQQMVKPVKLTYQVRKLGFSKNCSSTILSKIVATQFWTTHFWTSSTKPKCIYVLHSYLIFSMQIKWPSNLRKWWVNHFLVLKLALFYVTSQPNIDYHLKTRLSMQ